MISYLKVLYERLYHYNVTISCGSQKYLQIKYLITGKK